MLMHIQYNEKKVKNLSYNRIKFSQYLYHKIKCSLTTVPEKSNTLSADNKNKNLCALL